MSWTKLSYNALFNWPEVNKKSSVRKILLKDGLDDAILKLENANNLGVWYALTKEAAEAVGQKIIEESANIAEAELTAIASTLGRKGGSVKSESKKKASAENGKKGGRPKKKPIEGYVNTVPELKYTADGLAMTQFDLITNDKTNKIISWGKLAEVSNMYLKKGSRIIVSGKIGSKNITAQNIKYLPKAKP